MHGAQPATPAEVLDIPLALRLALNAVCKSAEAFGYWDRPYRNAAASFEDMTLIDKFYWAYKCTHPIARMEKGEQALTRDPSAVGLPPGFDKQHAITLGAGGDLLYGEALEHSKDLLFENIADLLFGRTVSYANFESPVTGQPLQAEVIGDKESPTECCSRAQFDILKGHKHKRFSVLHTANNHMADMGLEGVESTLQALGEEGIVDIGTNRSPDAHGQGRILVADGIKLGFAAATFSLNGRTLPAGEDYRINVATMLSKTAAPELDLIKRQIDDCKAKRCDFIIASLHWGYEFELFPRRRQVEMAHRIVEWGADAVIAHHPHVIQPIEYYRTHRDPNRVAVIAYSLGSLTWAFSAPYLVLSLILNLTLAKGRLGGTEATYIEQADVTPVFRSVVDSGGQLVTRIEKLADHLGGRSRVHPPDYIAAITRYADLVLGDT